MNLGYIEGRNHCPKSKANCFDS